MSKHETALAMIDEQIEKIEKDLRLATGAVATSKGTLERAEKEVQLINYSLKELRASKSALTFDRTAAETPVGGW